MKTAPVKTETMVALASLALQSAKKLFQDNLENKGVTLTLSGADVCTRWYCIAIDPYTYWGLYRFFSGTFP